MVDKRVKRAWIVALILLAVAVAGCSQNKVHTKIPINNILFFKNSVGIVYSKDGKVYMAIIDANNTTPFMKTNIDATLVFRQQKLEKVIINGTQYNVTALFLRKVSGYNVSWVKLPTQNNSEMDEG